MDVSFEPYKKVTFQSYLSYESSEAFANFIALATPPGVPAQNKLFWANGILFRFYAHAPSDAIAKEIVNGHLMWDHIEFAPMPKYQNEIKIAERPLVNINVLNVSNHVVLGQVTKWIYDNLVKKTPK